LCCVWQLAPQPPVLWFAVLQSANPDVQVYEQLPLLQLTLVSFDTLHTLPQPPQLFVFVCVLTHCALHVVSRHAHDPAEQSGVGCVQVA
jgi:hypothetical protein